MRRWTVFSPLVVTKSAVERLASAGILAGDAACPNETRVKRTLITTAREVIFQIDLRYWSQWLNFISVAYGFFFSVAVVGFLPSVFGAVLGLDSSFAVVSGLSSPDRAT